MNLTWHIMKKDLAKMRLSIVLWALVLASQVVVSDRLLSIRSVDYTWFANTGMFFNQLVALGVAFCFIMSAALVLDDPLVGTDMAWVTRPISGGRLLRAKVLFAALVFGLLPVLVWIPWWLYCHFSVGEMALAAVRVMGVHAFGVISAFVLASLLGQAGRFVLFSVLMLGVILVVVLNLMTWDGYRALPPELVETRIFVSLGVLAVSGVVVVVKQYLTRRLGSSAILLSAGLLLTALVAAYWPWNLMNLGAASRTELAGSAAISGEIQEMRIAALSNTPGPEDIGVSIKIRFKGVPDEVSLSSGVADVELRWPDGATLRKNSVRMVSDYWQARNEESSMLQALGLPSGHSWLHHWDPETEAKHAQMIEIGRQRMLKSGSRWHERKHLPGAAWLTVTLPVTPEMATKIEANLPSCSISARIVVKKPRLLFEMPLKGDSWMAAEGARLHLLNLSPQTWHDLSHEPVKALLATMVSTSAPGLDGLSLYTLDRVHGTAVFQGRTSSFSVVPVPANIEGLYFSVGDPQLWRTDKWVESPGWLESSTLAAVTFQDVGGFNRDFHTDRLVIGKDSEE